MEKEEVSISLSVAGCRTRFSDFQVIACRIDKEVKFLLQGFSVDLCGYMVICDFSAPELDLALDVCGMLNQFVEFLLDGYSERQSRGCMAILFPDTFKYLAEFGYQLSDQEVTDETD